MSDINDLWPSFDEVPKIISPRSILSEQANILSSKTKNLLSATAKSITTNDGRIVYRFVIRAPLLRDYSYTLLSLYHDAFYYPCDIKFEGTGYTARNEEELREILKIIFNNDKTKQVIVSLLGQSKEVEEARENEI